MVKWPIEAHGKRMRWIRWVLGGSDVLKADMVLHGYWLALLLFFGLLFGIERHGSRDDWLISALDALWLSWWEIGSIWLCLPFKSTPQIRLPIRILLATIVFIINITRHLLHIKYHLLLRRWLHNHEAVLARASRLGLGLILLIEQYLL